MLKRIICATLAMVMLAAALPVAVLSEGMSAGEALFGEGNYTEPAYDTGDDIYGANDTASFTNYPTLRLGDRDGEDGVAYIVFMQNRLIELDYLADEADGYYGENTRQAIKEFQKANGLEATGIADPSTQEKLYSDASTLVRASADSTLYGSDVMRTQNAMAQWGFMFSKVDGKMGNNTRTAIKNFKKYMAKVDPSFGTTPTPVSSATPEASTSSVFGDMPAAMDMLLEGANPLVVTADGEIDETVLNYVDGVMPFQVFRQVVRNGDKGDEVERVQKRLKSLKYLYSADGAFGKITEDALKYFQKKHHLKETGIADKQTQERLFSASALPSEDYVFPYKIVVDVSDQRVYVGQWNGSSYKNLVKKFKCSSGKKGTPTPLGTYHAYGRAGGEWYYFKDFHCYAKWATRIVGGILFHSVTYNRNKRPSGSERNLGRRASHGCIRLRVADAKWIYDNCPRGTTVVIQN
ncbi:MAG: peptidoglycan-binding protein [Clostridia bacterium]|nr:peptidoglycan-binding protein [Clostridia bacterium]